MTNVTVIIQNFDDEATIEECLNSVFAQVQEGGKAGINVVVVDHGSMDESPNIVAERFPQVDLRVIPAGKGAVYGINHGISAASGEYIMLLSSKVILASDCLSKLLECMDADKRIFAAAPKLLRRDERRTIEALGYTLTLSGEVKKIAAGKSAAKFNKPKKIFAPSNLCALYRRSIIGVAGGFDDSFFTYYEDADIAYRAYLCGFHGVLCPGAAAYVTRAESDSNYEAMLSSRNRIFMYYKNMPAFWRMINAPFLSRGTARRKRFYKKLGAGSYYSAGVREGKKNKKRLCVNKRHKRPFLRHLKLQGRLAKNSFKSIFGR